MTKSNNYQRWIQAQRDRAIKNNEPIYSVRQGVPQDRLPKQEKKAPEPKLASHSGVSELLSSELSLGKLTDLFWGELPPSSYTVTRVRNSLYIYNEKQQKEVFRRRYTDMERYGLNPRSSAVMSRASTAFHDEIWYDRGYFNQEYAVYEPTPEPKKISIGI